MKFDYEDNLHVNVCMSGTASLCWRSVPVDLIILKWANKCILNPPLLSELSSQFPSMSFVLRVCALAIHGLSFQCILKPTEKVSLFSCFLLISIDALLHNLLWPGPLKTSQRDLFMGLPSSSCLFPKQLLGGICWCSILEFDPCVKCGIALFLLLGTISII